MSLELARYNTGTVTLNEKQKLYYMRDIPDARCPQNRAVFILKGDENKKTANSNRPRDGRERGNFIHKKYPPRNRGRENT